MFTGERSARKGVETTLGRRKSGHIIQDPISAKRTSIQNKSQSACCRKLNAGRSLVGVYRLQAQRNFGEEAEELLIRSGSSSP